jgi:hypothetical protein
MLRNATRRQCPMSSRQRRRASEPLVPRLSISKSLQRLEERLLHFGFLMMDTHDDVHVLHRAKVPKEGALP